MFKRHDVSIVSNPLCKEAISEIKSDNFRYYDKDGFELNLAEQAYYQEMNFPINSGILNHRCWQELWFEIEDKNSNLLLDHSMILTRAAYSGNALDQLKKISKNIPESQFIINTPQKWGYDFALDAVNHDGKVFEVIHIEYDNKNFNDFSNSMITFEYKVRHTDWQDVANKIWNHRDKWQNLKSFAQNDWKAKFILGWKKAEFTEKSLT